VVILVNNTLRAILPIVLCLLINSFSSLALADELGNPKTMAATQMTLLKPSEAPMGVTAYLIADWQRAIFQEQADIKRSRTELEKWQQEVTVKITTLNSVDVDEDLLNKAIANREAMEIEVEKIRLEQLSAQNNIEKRRQALKEEQDALENLQKTPLMNAETPAMRQASLQLFEDNTLLLKVALNQDRQRLENTEQRAEIAKQKLTIATQLYDKVQTLYQNRRKTELEAQIRAAQQPFINQATALRAEISALNIAGGVSAAEQDLFNVRIQEVEARAEHAVRHLRAAYIEGQLAQINNFSTQNLTHVEQDKIEENLQTVDELIVELLQLENLLQEKISLLTIQLSNIQKRGENLRDNDLLYNQQSQNLIAELQGLLKIQRGRLQLSLEQAHNQKNVLEEAYKIKLRATLLRQRELPSTAEAWQGLLQEIARVPILFGQQLQLTAKSLWQAMQQTDRDKWLLIGFGTLIWLSVFIWIRILLIRLYTRLSNKTEGSYAINSIMTSLLLLNMNTISVAITGWLLLLLALIQPTPTSVTMITWFIIIFFGIKLPLNLAHLIIHSHTELTPTQQRHLYLRWQVTVIISGLFAAFVVMAHLLAVSQAARDLTDSLFMLFLSWTVLPVMRLRRVILAFISQFIQSYWLWVIRLITLLIPLSIAAVAVLGVIGYINLGWYVAQNLSLLLLVLTAWLILRGVVNDAIVLLKNYALRHSHYGLLWTQDVIPLGHRLLNIGLFVLAVGFFLWLNGWYNDAAVRSSTAQFFNHTLFALGENRITVADGLVAILTVWVVFWFGSWIRQVTYRWIYLNINDLGARHSLSVFTQYLVVLIGLLVALRWLGVDLTTLTVFAGALGVGIGFGLQSIANNFISGVLLLAERPLRTGDIINIGGNHEGHVMRIGMRSLTIRAWDYKEVIVPNSQLITNAFTNWTHSNQFLRTTLYVRVTYDSEPKQVSELLTQILQDHPDIVDDPESSVTLWEFSEYALLFRLDYFINLQHASAFATRNAVLMTIWDKFRAAGIKIPYPQQDVHLRSMPAMPPSEQMLMPMSNAPTQASGG